MTTYHSSDWHLGHARIIELCDRPFASTIAMNRTIISNTNDIVTEDDVLVLHGDNVMGTYNDNLRLLAQLRAGTVIFMPGNHDRTSMAHEKRDAKREEAMKHIYTTLPRLNVKVVRDRKPSAWRGKVAGHDVLLSHYPYTGDSTGRDRHVDMRPRDEGLPLIHGHVHGAWRENGRQLNVGVDVWDFAPVSEHAIALWLDSLPTKVTA